ncbi:MAG TPA: cytochrome P450 [Acidimicrobiales bacterium]|nr:cytochrome P450 [Acidimicrobiales bacterium]
MSVTAPTTTDRPTADLLDPSFYVDLDAMHEAFRWMRANEPVYRDEANALWAVTRHADVIDVERRAKVFVSGQGYRSFHSPSESNMIAQDDPGHAEQRALVARRFTPKAVLRHEETIRSMVTGLLDSIAEAGRMEVVGDLAAPLPCKLTAHLLGFPEDAWPEVRSWSERLMRIDRMTREPEVAMDLIMACQEFQAVLDDVVPARREEPADDLVSVWANAEVGGCPMSGETIFHETGLFISGGAETTRTVIARGIAALCEHPEQWEAIAADPALVPHAVEELIRWVTPLNNFFRTATADATIADTAVATGDRVILLYPSANRDEAVFDDPYRFDVARAHNNHVAFGFGPHVCVGAPLARLELRILFEELARRFTNLHALGPLELEASIFATAVERFEVGFDLR